MVSAGKYEGVTSTAFEQSNVWGCALCVRKFNNAKAILEDMLAVSTSASTRRNECSDGWICATLLIRMQASGFPGEKEERGERADMHIHTSEYIHIHMHEHNIYVYIYIKDKCIHILVYTKIFIYIYIYIYI